MAVPTETVYGLAAHALDPVACRKIFQAKRRPAFDPLIVHVLNLDAAELLAVWNDEARSLAHRFWPGPLTIVLPRRDVVPDIVTSGRDSVALRSPRHPVMRRLLRLAGCPLAAPSANPFGGVSPTTAAHVVDGLGSRIEHVLDGGTARLGVESTIIDLRQPGKPIVLRPGSISRAQLSQVLGRTRIGRKRSSRGQTPDAPGMLGRHYSPKVPLTLVPAGQMKRAVRAAGAKDALVYYRPPTPASRRGPGRVYWLTKSDGVAAARSLYQVLRQVDRPGTPMIYFEMVPAGAGPIAEAINDRLIRAAGRG